MKRKGEGMRIKTKVGRKKTGDEIASDTLGEGGGGWEKVGALDFMKRR
jgi:hypothetical protein